MIVRKVTESVEKERIARLVLEVGSEGSFTDGNIERAEYDAERMILRACQKGKPTYRDGTVIVEGKYYKPINN